MCMPTLDDRTILDLLEEMEELGFHGAQMQKPACQLCKPEAACWFHRSYAPHPAHEEMK